MDKHRWIQGEIRDGVAEGLVTETQAKMLTRRYPERPKVAGLQGACFILKS